MLETMRRGAAAFASGGLKRGFNGWCAWVDVRMEMEAKVRAAAAALRSGLRKAFNTWADLIGTVDPRKRLTAEQVQEHMFFLCVHVSAAIPARSKEAAE